MRGKKELSEEVIGVRDDDVDDMDDVKDVAVMT